MILKGPSLLGVNFEWMVFLLRLHASSQTLSPMTIWIVFASSL